VLSDEFEVVFNLISSYKDLERGAARLKLFVDLYFILNEVNRRLDWKAFLEHRRREKILRITVNVLAFFFDLFDCQHKFPETAAAAEWRAAVLMTGAQVATAAGFFWEKISQTSRR